MTDQRSQILAAMLTVGVAILISSHWFGVARDWVQRRVGGAASPPQVTSTPSIQPQQRSGIQPQSFGLQGTPAGGVT